MINKEDAEMLMRYGINIENLSLEQISKLLDNIIEYNENLINSKKQEIIDLISD